VTAAVLDCALAQLLEKRLSRSKNEAADFLGLNGDGRAPCAAFGARIQLAYLLGIFDSDVFEILKTVKGIRNVFAHCHHTGGLVPDKKNWSHFSNWESTYGVIATRLIHATETCALIKATNIAQAVNGVWTPHEPPLTFQFRVFSENQQPRLFELSFSRDDILGEQTVTAVAQPIP
jgi:hypothetical protein